jgi:hypothetical protein
MKKQPTLPIDSISGFASILIYSVFTCTSILYFPQGWNPLTHTLSQLGDSTLNPNGALFYTLGMILGGLALLLFYTNMYKRYTNEYRDRQLDIAIILGYSNGISVILSGATPENLHFTLHVIFSLLIFMTFPPIIYIMGRHLDSHSIIPKTVYYYGYLVVFFTLLLLGSIFVSGVGGLAVPLLESLSVFSFLGWIALFSYTPLHNKT